jgi:hypothetical protein
VDPIIAQKSEVEAIQQDTCIVEQHTLWASSRTARASRPKADAEESTVRGAARRAKLAAKAELADRAAAKADCSLRVVGG